MPHDLARSLAWLGEKLRTSAIPGTRNEPLTGMVWVTLAMALFAGLAAFGRYCALAGMHPFEIVFFRNLFCFVFLLPLVWVRGPALWTSSHFDLYAARVGLSFVSMMAWFSALAMIPIAQLMAFGFLAPLFATLTAIIALGEVVRLRRWTALAVGFAGAMVILRPFDGTVSFGQLLALFAALLSGVIGPLVKQQTRYDDADRIVFITTAMLLPVSLVPALFVWEWPTLALLPPLIGMGFCAVAGHAALVRGFASMDASLVFSCEFSRLPFAALIGWLLFGEATDIWTWIGAAIIFSAGFYIIRRESRLKSEGS